MQATLDGLKTLNQVMSYASEEIGGEPWLDRDGRIKFETWSDRCPAGSSYWFEIEHNGIGYYLNGWHHDEIGDRPIGQRALPWRDASEACITHIVVLSTNLIEIDEAGPEDD